MFWEGGKETVPEQKGVLWLFGWKLPEGQRRDHHFLHMAAAFRLKPGNRWLEKC